MTFTSRVKYVSAHSLGDKELHLTTSGFSTQVLKFWWKGKRTFDCCQFTKDKNDQWNSGEGFSTATCASLFLKI